jgi:hypothetical protein
MISSSPVASNCNENSDNNNPGSLHFYPELEETVGDENNFFVVLHQTNLLRGFDVVAGPEPDEIKRISIYETPLSRWQISAKLFYHAFIVITSENWFFSIEATDQHIVMQRSKKLSLLLQMVEDEKRYTTPLRRTPKCARDAKGKGHVRDIVARMYKEERVLQTYNIISRNCKDLAKWIYDNFNSEGQTYDLLFAS